MWQDIKGNFFDDQSTAKLSTKVAHMKSENYEMEGKIYELEQKVARLEEIIKKLNQGEGSQRSIATEDQSENPSLETKNNS